MTRSEEFEAENLDTALEQAARRAGRRKDDLTYRVVREDRGLLGAVTRSIVIRVDFGDAPPAAVAARSTPSRPAPMPPAPAVPAESRREAETRGEELDEEAEAGEVTPSGPDPTAPQVAQLVAELVASLGLELQSAMTEEAEKIVVNLSGPDRDLLLGPKAEVLDACQYLVNRMSRKKLGTVKRIQLESDGFRSDREEEVREMALAAAARARRGGESVRLPPLNPYERRIVHVTLSSGQGVSTESEGDGFVKRVIVRPLGGPPVGDRSRGGGQRRGRSRGGR